MTQLITSDKNEEIRQYYRKRLYEKSLKSIGEIPQLGEPSFEQKEYFVKKMKSNNWRSCK